MRTDQNSTASCSEFQAELFEIDHDSLAVEAAKFLKKSRCPIVFVKNNLMYLQEQPDVIAFGLLYPCVVVVEVKTSRADFLKYAQKQADKAVLKLDESIIYSFFDEYNEIEDSALPAVLDLNSDKVPF